MQTVSGYLFLLAGAMVLLASILFLSADIVFLLAGIVFVFDLLLFFFGRYLFLSSACWQCPTMTRPFREVQARCRLAFPNEFASSFIAKIFWFCL